MPHVYLMGLVNQNPDSRHPPADGFNLPAYRYIGQTWNDTHILVPGIRNDVITYFNEYDTRNGGHPIWNNNRLTGATMVSPNQPALYAFKFPHGETYIAIREVMIGRLNRWLKESEILDIETEVLQQARIFCDKAIPESLRRQIDALMQYATRVTPGSHRQHLH